MENEQHKRRVRYKGLYPRKFEEKYKELNPEKYTETALKVISKGGTPAGTHRPICVKEILEFFDIQPGQRGLDATLGYGGHTSLMLEALKGNGHIYALDVDPIESVKTEKRLRERGFDEEMLTVIHTNFANIKEVSEKYGKFDFVLADLGVSSMQIDNPERGFSYKQDGPLDLRLNPNEGVSASERLKELTRDEIEGMLTENSDEPYAKELSRAIESVLRKEGNIETTTRLREIIEDTLEKRGAEKEMIKKSCQRVFQALRIDVNSEFEVLDKFLSSLPDVLNSGGKAAILTFHSGEDRMVKQYFKVHCKEGIYSSAAKDVIRPDAQECSSNPRAKSTKMRWAVKA